MEADCTAVPVLRCATGQLLMQPWQHHAPWVWPCAAQDAHAGVHMCSSLRRLSLHGCLPTLVTLQGVVSPSCGCVGAGMHPCNIPAGSS